MSNYRGHEDQQRKPGTCSLVVSSYGEYCEQHGGHCEQRIKQLAIDAFLGVFLRYCHNCSTANCFLVATMLIFLWLECAQGYASKARIQGKERSKRTAKRLQHNPEWPPPCNRSKIGPSFPAPYSWKFRCDKELIGFKLCNKLVSFQKTSVGHVRLTLSASVFPRETVNLVSKTVSHGRGEHPESNFVNVEGKLQV